MIKKLLKLFSAVIFVCGLSQAGYGKENFELSVYFPYDYNVLSQDDRPELNFDQGSSGLAFHMKSPLYLGLGISLYEKKFLNRTNEAKLKINNFFFDITYKLPVPEFLNLTAGLGIGQSELTCDNKICSNNYDTSEQERLKSNSVQFFVNMGFTVGYIYKLNFGYSKVNTGDLKIINKASRASVFEINGDSDLYMLGVSITFI